MDSKLKTIALWAGLGAGVTMSSILLYLLLKPEEEYEVKRRKVETTKHTVVKVTVPKEVVGGVIGRQGANIKRIQEKTNTKISFDNQGTGEECDRIAVIRGVPSDVQDAEELLKACIVEQSNVVTETVFVPAKSCGRIIGRNGETVRHMCRVSSAKILVDRAGGDDRERSSNLKTVSITGTREQIRMAITMIDEKLAEEEAYQQKMALASAGRAALYRNRPMAIKASATPLSKDEKEPEFVQEELVATSADGYIEVYVSALESPRSFWVQLVGSQSINLDKLVEDMTNYYSHVPNQQTHALVSAAVGDIVASRFAQDSCWYRARVVAIEESDYSKDETTIKVHYVDFGETGRFKTKELCTLCDEYRYLPLQAIECSLAGVQPRDGTQWTEEASDLFEMLSHAAQWKVMMAKVVSKAKREDGFPGFKYSVDLVDTNNKEDVSVASELMSQGHAVQAV
ncbi:hypothetical protein HPB49_009874 [Dermacentor silvarum]|uniref:Uncharacterized protein n=1 Tax=Dermacentor silvarum TaxID=543639 RepID=A0ACB8C8P6_DERSI|nr:tudor and KH domain-containing protein [Dermacentor silvarum]KAH7937264.1 hypothetical protein HPB49_009874 [Dermacentor silvarum]